MSHKKHRQITKRLQDFLLFIKFYFSIHASCDLYTSLKAWRHFCFAFIAMKKYSKNNMSHVTDNQTILSSEIAWLCFPVNFFQNDRRAKKPNNEARNPSKILINLLHSILFHCLSFELYDAHSKHSYNIRVNKLLRYASIYDKNVFALFFSLRMLSTQINEISLNAFAKWQK